MKTYLLDSDGFPVEEKHVLREKNTFFKSWNKWLSGNPDMQVMLASLMYMTSGYLSDDVLLLTETREPREL